MKIAVIGTGNVGSALAEKWADAGHEIFLGVRDTANFKGKELLKLKGVTALETKAAVAAAEVILIAAPAPVAAEVAASLGDTTGKVIIDAMNVVAGRGPAGFKSTAPAILAHTQARDVVKAFNTTGFNNIKAPNYAGTAIDAFVAGSSARGKEIAKRLALDAGFAACYDVGGDDKFELMEQFAFFWINLAMMQGLGRDIAFKLLKR
ncbi:MAG: NAD(P)-binding domain-containing protein [Leptospirales bacterium]|nr:NAD(P)-binding domain-containing protein [Leptospirales bacterium]